MANKTFIPGTVRANRLLLGKGADINRILFGSVVADLASILDGDMVAQDITVTGAALGDFCLATCSIDVLDLQITATVTAANTVTLVVSNSTGGAVDLGSATYSVIVIRAADGSAT